MQRTGVAKLADALSIAKLSLSALAFMPEHVLPLLRLPALFYASSSTSSPCGLIVLSFAMFFLLFRLPFSTWQRRDISFVFTARSHSDAALLDHDSCMRCLKVLFFEQYVDPPAPAPSHAGAVPLVVIAMDLDQRANATKTHGKAATVLAEHRIIRMILARSARFEGFVPEQAWYIIFQTFYAPARSGGNP